MIMTMKKRMKAGKLEVLLVAFGLMCAVTGCTKTSEKAEGQEEDVIRLEASTDESAVQDEDAAQRVDGSQEQENDQEEERKAEEEPESMEQISDESELEGNVKSIGEDSMVISKIFTYTEDGNDIAVASAEGGPDEVLITVYFSEDTEYIVRTVKNAGVNGDSDVEDRTGALSDIQEGNSVLMNGSYEGEDFHAVRVVIYNFI